LLKGFTNFLMKELKELIRDPKILIGMIIVPALMFPLLGGIINFSTQSAREQAEKAAVFVLNNDLGNYSEILTRFLNFSVKTFVVNNTTPEEAVAHDLLSYYNATQFIEIPSGFSANMTEHLQGNPSIRASVNLYGVFSIGSVFGNIGSSVVEGLMEQFNREVAPNVVHADKSTIIKGEIQKGVDPSLLSGVVLSQAIAMPIIIMILLSYSMQVAATSVAMEKEEKTLETLLSLPMDRFAILMGKLSGSILVAALGALAFLVGLNYYTGSLMATIPSGTSVDLVSLGLVPSLFGYLLLGISLFVTLLSALALAIIVSAFAEDVKSAQAVVGYIYPIIFIPSIALMYLDFNTLPLALKIILYAIPYSHPILASKAIIIGDYWTAVLGIVYVAAFTLVIMYAASRLFATEKILTAKLKFRGLRKRKETPAEELQ
jgi:ABC-2 type transport system permease protein